MQRRLRTEREPSRRPRRRALDRRDQLVRQGGPRETITQKVAGNIYKFVKKDTEKICKGCHPYLKKAFMYLIII